jgi:hypothetical protein
MGQACCAGATACTGTGLVCNAAAGGGGGTCGACGAVGEACCPDPNNAQVGLCTGTSVECVRAAGGGGGGGRLTCNACGASKQACCGTGAVATRTCTAGTCGATGFCP